ncbi:hypothetical protein LPJ66_007671 [Kickxella alabastrina]|uniref:Uncharacterized protein n=1 Tax=Kickxella alabastrina TaxID=61397 RepID=A0ACC1IBX2_9FUNG|nr:hypothetical protein LPJ66_007671 [Kickxella alabastrina]
MAGPGTGIMKGSRSLSPLSESEHNRGSASPSVSSSQSSSPTVGYSPLTSGHPQQQQQQQHQLMALVAAAAATTSSPSESRNNSDGGMTAATTPVWKSEPRAAIAKPANSGYITASALGGLHVQYSYYDKNYEHQQPKQKSGARSIVNKLPSLSSLPSAGMDLGDLDHKRRESSSSQYVANGHSSSQPLHKLAEFTDKGVRMSNDRQFAHTRNDMWFNRTAPSNLEYLYRNDHQQQQLPRMVHPCVDRPAAEVAALNTNVDELSSMPASHTPRNVSVHRSMSLMDMLNAPPEQRKLPPLPPIGQ